MADNVFLGTSGSPNDLTNVGNWSLGHTPANTENIWFPAGNSVNITTNLGALSAITVASLNFDPNFTGKIGVLTGVALTYLQIGATVINFPAGTGSGSSLIAINTAAVPGTVNVQQSGNFTVPPLRFLGTNLTYNLTGGSVAVAAYPGETATVVSARLSSGVTGTAPALLLGSGVTLTDCYMEAGSVISYSAQVMPAVRVAGGTYDYRGSGAHSQMDSDSGTIIYSGTGTINGNSNIRGVLDFRQDDRAKTVTNPIILYAGASLYADTRYVKAPGPAALAFTLNHCRFSDVRLDLGSNVAVTALAS